MIGRHCFKAFQSVAGAAASGPSLVQATSARGRMIRQPHVLRLLRFSQRIIPRLASFQPCPALALTTLTGKSSFATTPFSLMIIPTGNK